MDTSATVTRPRLARAVVLIGACVWLSRLVTAWADRTASALTFFGLALAIVVVLDWLVIQLGPGLWRFIRSVCASIWAALGSDAELTALRTRHSRFFRWLSRRTSAAHADGLYLTGTVLSTGYFLASFISIVAAVSHARAIASYDPQLVALLRAFRTPALTRVFWVATAAADPRVVGAAAIAAVLILLAWGRRSESGLLLSTLLMGLAVLTALERALTRPAPPVAFALVASHPSVSIVSGHVLMSFLLIGIVLFIYWRTSRDPRHRLEALSLASIAATWVGVSRVYLGVHWPSDVIASWALGAAILSAACGSYLALMRYRGTRERREPWSTEVLRRAATAGVVVATCLAILGGALSDPLLARIRLEPSPVVLTVDHGAQGTIWPTARQLQPLPVFTEKLDGSHQEPIGLVFVGTQSELESAFHAAGWRVADQPSPATLLHASFAALLNRAYPTAPVTPAFLDGSVQNVAFEKPAGAATVRRRHHARFWETRFRVDGEPVWIATASFDSRLEIGSAIPLPTHHIQPNIDAEQAYVVKDLVGTGDVGYRGRVRVTVPTSGTNAQGDTWFTQGYASVLQTGK